MKTLLILAFAAVLLNAGAVSQLDGPNVGDVAPPLNITKWLQAPPEAAKSWPAGKVVVLEFWATTCAPCVAVIPHLNELADRFKGKPVQFIAVADEGEGVIGEFLKKKPIKAWIGLGEDALFSEANPYKVFAVPHTVIIDAHGRIAAIMDPRDLTYSLITQCLAGKPLPDNRPIVAGAVPGQYQAGIAPLFQALILPSSATRDSTTGKKTGAWDAGALTLKRAQLRYGISIAFDTPWTRIISEAELPKEKYDFYVTLPKGQGNQKGMDRLAGVFAQAVEATFSLSVKREVREMDVLVLRTNANSMARLVISGETKPDNNTNPGTVSITNWPLSVLARGMEDATMTPVFDETGLTNRYTLELRWNQKSFKDSNIDGLIAAVKKSGLDLVPAKRPVEVVVVRKSP